MVNKPKGNGEQKDKNVATFFFSKEDLTFLQVRQALISQYQLLIGDMDYAIKQYIIQNFCVRESIDITKYKVNYDILEGKVTVEPLIIKPNNKIILPQK